MSTLRDVLWHVVTILKSEMALDDSRVYIYNQKYQLPTSPGILVAVGLDSEKPFGSKTELDGNGNEVQSVNTSALLWCEIVSQDISALERKEEISMALGSQFSQSMQEKFGFHIGRLPPTPIANLSDIEGASIPYRFRIAVQVQYQVKKTKAGSYFETFPENVTVES